MTKQEKDTYLRCLGYAVKIYRLRRGMTQEQQKNAPANLKGQREQIEGYSSELKKGRELKASLYI